MRDHGFDHDTADRFLDGDARREQLPSELRPVADLLHHLRTACAAARDPEAEATDVRAMAETVRSTDHRSWPSRPRLLPLGLRVALAVVTILVAATAGSAIAGGPVPGSSVAHAVLTELGLESEDERDREEDLRDREEDLAELEEDRAEREAEGGEPLPAPAAAGRGNAAAKRKAAEMYTGAVRSWTDCIRAATARHEESGTDEEFDPVAACGAHPRPGQFGLGYDDGEEADAAGPNSEQDSGADRAGPAPGPPSTAGPPPGAGPPSTAGPPADAGPPDGAGPKRTSGAPFKTVPPPNAGPPPDAGPPPSAGPPPDAGPPPGAGQGGDDAEEAEPDGE